MDTDMVLALLKVTCDKSPDRIFTPSLMMDTLREKFGEGQFTELKEVFSKAGSPTGDENDQIAYYLAQTMMWFYAMLENPDQAKEKLPKLRENLRKFEAFYIELDE